MNSTFKGWFRCLEFYNPGGLPEDITPKNITEKQFSRNPDGRITNKDYRKLFPEIIDRTVLNDLKDMTKKGILAKIGKTKNVFYQFRNNSEINMSSYHIR